MKSHSSPSAPETDPAMRARMVQTARVLQGFTQRELAERAGVTITTLYRAEKGLPVRTGSLTKIARGLDTDLGQLLEEKPVVGPETPAPLVHRAAENVWFAPIDRRRHVPEENAALIQSPTERRRLGTLGLAPIFACYPKLVMAEGPGITLIEVYGHYPHPFNPEIYRDCIVHCLRGAVRLAILDDEIELTEGDLVGFGSKALRWIEPLRPLESRDPTPLVQWIGAVRLGRVQTVSSRRPIVRKPKPHTPEGA